MSARGGLPPAIPAGLSAVAGGLGLLVLFFAWRIHAANVAAESFPSVPGEVTRSELRELEYRDEQSGERRIRQELDFAVKYTVAGHTYESTHVDATGFSSSDRDAARRYPPGAAVTVYYDPANPGSGGPERGSSLAWVFLGLAGVACEAVSVAFAVGAIRLAGPAEG